MVPGRLKQPCTSGLASRVSTTTYEGVQDWETCRTPLVMSRIPQVSPVIYPFGLMDGQGNMMKSAHWGLPLLGNEALTDHSVVLQGRIRRSLPSAIYQRSTPSVYD
ncbi:hypothetical protein VTL71DRAFT_12427 [Oculimacula yallundae]|uniref:Uncharacterized protein n=1 Tax=Oculimacula yallundae TaxID=86028 RepID=A0ABR4CNS6_9HELO